MSTVTEFVPKDLDGSTWSALEPLYTALIQRELKCPKCLEKLILDRSELDSAAAEAAANLYIETTRHTDDEDIKKLLKKMIKQRAESIDIYKKNNREDLLNIEENEHKILSSYLPKQLSEEETKKICSELAQKVGASSIKDMGKVMAELKKNYSDTLDFSKAGSLLKEILGK